MPPGCTLDDSVWTLTHSSGSVRPGIAWHPEPELAAASAGVLAASASAAGAATATTSAKSLRSAIDRI